jgi:AraC-like DNA-binding protein
MEYAQYLPRPPLSRWVRAFWMLRSGEGGGGAAESVFPDGCVEIVFHLADPFVHVPATGTPAAQPAAMVVGPTTRPMRIAPSGAVDVVGIRFEPHGAQLGLGLPCEDLVDLALPLADVTALRAGEWMERLAASGDWPSRVLMLERELQDLVDVRRSEPLVEAASWIIGRSGGRVTVDMLSRELGVRPRRLERRFRARVGIAPKKLCRITRFQRLLGDLESGTLAGAAVRCGYTDQAHLTRDFREFAGVTPAAFRDGDDILPRLFAGLPVGS